MTSLASKIQNSSRSSHVLQALFSSFSPVSKTYETYRVHEDKDKLDYAGKGAEEPVIWYKQTIRNACGLIGVLHAVSNGTAKDFISDCTTVTVGDLC